ncbi:hypothetical protein Tco_1130088 [Tanacetum coccineum]
MFLTRFYRYVVETYPHLDNGIYDVVERVMRPLARSGSRASPTFRGSNTRSGSLWSGGLDQKKKGANRDQHSRDQRAQSGGLWSGGLDPKRGANRDQHSRDQRGR